ncbi:MAG TPA: amidohydrolase family protein [Thermoanaerobaculia bacterium]|nr:amidohydrolase family protein [Thermoanaerobaculia bacterium]
MKSLTCGIVVLLLSSVSPAQSPPAPVIDMHLHSHPADVNGPPPLGICAPPAELPTWDPKETWPVAFMRWTKNPECSKPIWSPMTDVEVMQQTIAVLRRRNITALSSGPQLDRWMEVEPDRILPALGFDFGRKPVPTPEQVRRSLREKRHRAFAEVGIQYQGVSPSGAKFEPYLAVAEQMDVPVGIHIGTGPPGARYLPPFPNYRARLHSPLVLEEALARHPRLRVWIMHAGWPMLDDLLAVLWAHPQVHVDVGVISWVLPRQEFHRYLQRIVEAGFVKRVMFGSDQMNWPGVIEPAIEAIESAPFLSEGQKREILFENAARFLRLTPEEVAHMTGARR